MGTKETDKFLSTIPVDDTRIGNVVGHSGKESLILLDELV